MATHSIGTGGDFATPALWEADIPATLTEQRVGQCKNEEFVVAGTVVDFSAHVTTSSFDIVLETESGAGFNQNVNVRTNALRYNASNGTGLRSTANYSPVILISGAIGHLTIRNLQLKCDATNNTGACVYYSGFHAMTLHLYKDIIASCAATNNVVVYVRSGGAAQIIRSVNVIAIQGHTSGNGFLTGAGDTQFINCAAIRPDNVSPSGTGFARSYDTPIMTNCAVFGFTTPTGTFSASSSNNASDAATGLPGTSNQHSVTYTQTSPFTNGDTTSGDYRLADDANALINNGVLDATNAPNDISGTARVNPCEIGVWELAAAVAAGNPHYYYHNQKITMGA